MVASNYAPIWDALKLGHPKPVTKARLVSPTLPEDSPDLDYAARKAGRPLEMRCIYYSTYRSAYYVLIRHKGKKYQRAFFDTPEKAMAARDELQQTLDSSHLPIVEEYNIPMLQKE